MDFTPSSSGPDLQTGQFALNQNYRCETWSQNQFIWLGFFFTFAPAAQNKQSLHEKLTALSKVQLLTVFLKEKTAEGLSLHGNEKILA